MPDHRSVAGQAETAATLRELGMWKYGETSQGVQELREMLSAVF